MEANLFRFVLTRPPQRVSEQELARQSVKTHPTEIPQTDLLHELLEWRALHNRAEMRSRSRRYIAAGAPDYIAHLGELSTPIEQIDQWILAQRSQLSSEALLKFIDSILSSPVSSLVQSDGYRQDRCRVADSLLAHYIASDPALPAPAHLVGAMRLFGLLERMAADRASLQHLGELQRVLKAIVRLPASLYPLPRFEDEEAAEREKLYQSRKDAYKEARERAQDLADRIVRHKRAMAELLEGDEADHHLSLVQAVNPPTLVDGDDSSPIEGQPVDTGENTASESLCVFLTPESARRLSKATRELLADMRVETDRISVVETVNRLERRVAVLAHELYKGSPFPQFVLMGNELVNANDFAEGGEQEDSSNVSFGIVLPGPCASTEPEGPSASEADLIISPGEIPSITPRIGELMLVEQRLHRYELGEVAHIENVLIGEKKDRTHRRKRTEEEILFIETEKTEEMEQDLQSTERFELQNETQEVIREETSMEAGLSVSAKYGWQVEVQADARYASNTAKEESRRSATNYSRDVTERAVSRVQERVLERRTHRVVVETEETNLHVLDNVKGKEHVVGVYRWVDKVYQAQVVSYGLHSMFEFVIPEPASFLKFAMASRVTADVGLIKPAPPAYCLLGHLIPLQPETINAGNYMFWASQYPTANVEPPPPLFRVIGKAFNSSSVQGDVFTASENGIRVPEGYIGRRAWIKDFTSPGTMWARVRGQWLREQTGWNGKVLEEWEGDLPVVLYSGRVSRFAANIVVECLRTQTAYEKWQLATYKAIMTAYNQQLAEYEDSIAAAQIQQGVAISGDNPLRNRQLERDELKREAISVLTGQHFDAFESLRKNVGVHRYPQLDLARAAKEGPFIRFFEQAFEWEHMAYLFYPYFWGRKDDWPKNVLLDDNDPLFAQFLRAGAARVVVPVRPGFEAAVNSYLAHGWPLPTGTGSVVPDEDEEGDQGNGQGTELPFLSLAAELQAQQGYDATPSAGTVKVKEGDAKVIGKGTAFEEDRDVGREIHIAGVKYHIAGVASETEITLERTYEGHSAEGLLYSLGPKYVGEPWEVRVPTSLVFLEDGTSSLPEFS